jgi:P-type Cu2+ transporter
MRQTACGAVGKPTDPDRKESRSLLPANGMGCLSPEIAALSMSGSSIIAALNAVWLRRLRLPGRAG